MLTYFELHDLIDQHTFMGGEVDATQERHGVAVRVAAIVADFVTRPMPDLDLSAADIEQWVADHSEEALGVSESDIFGPTVILPVLHRFGLNDDFFRMRRGDQADAFAA